MGKQDEINKSLDDSMRNNPAWAHLKAVQENHVYFLEPNLFLMNPGVKTPEALEIRVRLFLAMHKNPRVKSDNDLISASLGSRDVVIPPYLLPDRKRIKV